MLENGLSRQHVRKGTKRLLFCPWRWQVQLGQGRTGRERHHTNGVSVFVFVDSSLHSCHDIVLRRSSLGSWGFSIVGGYEENHTNQPFFIKTIVLGTPAYYDGRLK